MIGEEGSGAGHGQPAPESGRGPVVLQSHYGPFRAGRKYARQSVAYGSAVAVAGLRAIAAGVMPPRCLRVFFRMESPWGQRRALTLPIDVSDRIAARKAKRRRVGPAAWTLNVYGQLGIAGHHLCEPDDFLLGVDGVQVLARTMATWLDVASRRKVYVQPHEARVIVHAGAIRCAYGDVSATAYPVRDDDLFREIMGVAHQFFRKVKDVPITLNLPGRSPRLHEQSFSPGDPIWRQDADASAGEAA